MGVEKTMKDLAQMSESPREPLRTVENTMNSFGNKRSLSDYAGGIKPMVPSLDLTRVLPNFSKKQQQD